jgi:hypothetical protein
VDAFSQSAEPGAAVTVQEGLKRDPHADDLYVFRGQAVTVRRSAVELIEATESDASAEVRHQHQSP